MIKNIMCVSVCKTTTDIETTIGVYDVAVDSERLICVKLKREESGKFSNSDNVVRKIKMLTDINGIDLIIIDSRAFGITIADMLESDSSFKTPIHRAYVTSKIMTDSILTMKSFIQDNKIKQQAPACGFKIDFNKFDVNVLTKGEGVFVATLINSEHDDIFKNMLFIFGFAYNALSDIFNIKKRNIIENNLEEIVNILIDDLYKLQNKDIKEVERLTRLIDKVNYIRGQY